MSMDREDIKAMLMVEEGMEQLLQKNATLYGDMDSFVNTLASVSVIPAVVFSGPYFIY